MSPAVARLIERDDLAKERSIPASAKYYARRKGLKAITGDASQKAYVRMVADLTHNPVHGFKNRPA